MKSDPLVGALLDDRYRIEARIASGGMSTVYRGRDIRLDRPVALKVMDRRYAGDQQFLTRFQREARAIAQLKDPGLVAIYDQGADPAHPFLVMELVEGGTLRELLRERGPMPPHAMVAVLRPVLSGLGVAHRAGLVHRDVKPENVLIAEDGEVKLVDFGLVRAVAEAGITSTSVIVGTAAYLSPEQVLGHEAGPRSDVYSVGILAFELLTGTTPFGGDNPLAVAHQRLDRDVPSPGSVIDGVPPQLDAFIARATARDPAGRFADAAQMGGELDAIAEELSLPHFRVPTPRRAAPPPSADSLAGEETVSDTAATVVTERGGPDRQAPQPTRQFTPFPTPLDSAEDTPAETDPPPRQFAGIDLDEFAYARQRGRRTVALWVLAVLILAGLSAVAGWTLGLNLEGLVGH